MNRMLSSLASELRTIYDPREEMSRGRLVTLSDSLITALFNVFITGVFYTGFLSIYNISITNVGVLTFAPYIGSCFSVFSPMVLRRFKRRKPVLLLSKLLFYFIFVIATTVMPRIVTDSAARVRWFVGLILLAHAMYALFSPGLTLWFYAFYPKENNARMRYIMFNQLFSTIASSLILIVSSVIADSLSGSPHHASLLIGLRYFAFALVVIDVSIQALAKEIPAEETVRVTLKNIFTLPFRYRKFLMCLVLMFVWNYISNLNNGLWNYHLLNHLDFTYTMINVLTVMYTPVFLLLQRPWQRLIRKYSWVRAFGICILMWIPSEIGCFLMRDANGAVFFPIGVYQHMIAVGINLSYANILYINLPDDNATAHIAFYTVGCNIFAFLGLMTGTFVSSITGDHTFPFLGMNVYSVQFTTLMRSLGMLILGLILVNRWRSFEKEETIRLLDEAPVSRRIWRIRAGR